MKKAKAVGIGIGVFVLIIVIILGLVYYSYTQIHVSLNDVSIHSIDWAPFSGSAIIKLILDGIAGNWFGAVFDLIEGINLNLIFGLSNNGFLPVYIPDLSYDLSINDIPVGKGYSDAELTINPGQTLELSALQNFKKNRLSSVASSIVSTGGIIDLHVSGTAHFKLLGMDIPIPFESSKQVSIADEIKKRVESEAEKYQQEKDSFTSSIKNSLGSILDSIKNFLGISDDSNHQAPIVSKQAPIVHEHAAILVIIFGDKFDFSLPAYQLKNNLIRFEGGDGNTIHRLASDVTLDYLFDSLKLKVDDKCFVFQDGRQFCTNKDYALKFFINGKQVNDIRNYESMDNDRILIVYGAETPEEIQQQLSELNTMKIIE